MRRAPLLRAAFALLWCGAGPALAQTPAPPASTQAAVDPMDTSDRASLSDREVAERFIELFYNQNRLTDGFAAWVHPDYIQHDPNSPTGRDPVIALLGRHMAANPRMSHEVKRVIHGEDGLVAVHYHFRRAPEDRGSAVVNIFRIEHGYLVEHWDVIQPIPENPQNENTMF